MRILFAPFLDRLDSAYANASSFVRLKAGLLAAVTLLFLAVVPLNIAKNLWFQPPLVSTRICVNVILALAAAFSLRALLKGKLLAAANGLALTLVLIVNVSTLSIGLLVDPIHPVSVGIQIFAFDLAFLLFAIVFASRGVATAAFGLIVAAQFTFNRLILERANLDPSGRLS